MTDAIQHAAEILRERSPIVVLTGAGISAESGVPTFREAQTGLWAKYDPTRLATPEAFNADPELVTRWYDERRQNLRACKPNLAHHALVTLHTHATQRGGDFTLLTQNVDRLHHAAGSTDVVELHGNLWEWRCTVSGDVIEPPIPFPEVPMRSPAGGYYRPNVVWFGETLPEAAINRAHEAAAEAGVFLSIGTSSLVYPAAGLIEIAQLRGAATIEVNRDPTPISSVVDVCIHGKAGDVLPAIVAAL